MSTLEGVSIDIQDGEGELHLVTASWSDDGESAGLTVSRELVEFGDLSNVVTGLVDDIQRAIAEQTEWGEDDG